MTPLSPKTPSHPTRTFLRAKILRVQKHSTAARDELIGMIRAGSDGYAVRLMLADLASDAKDSSGARVELIRAHHFDPSMVEPLQALYDLDHRAKRETESLEWLRKIARLDQHDRKTYRLLLEGLVVAEAVRRGQIGRRVGHVRRCREPHRARPLRHRARRDRRSRTRPFSSWNRRSCAIRSHRERGHIARCASPPSTSPWATAPRPGPKRPRR